MSTQSLLEKDEIILWKHEEVSNIVLEPLMNLIIGLIVVISDIFIIPFFYDLGSIFLDLLMLPELIMVISLIVFMIILGFFLLMISIPKLLKIRSTTNQTIKQLFKYKPLYLLTNKRWIQKD